MRDETVTLDGLRFHYRDWGIPSASPVLLHGYTSHARSWDTVAKGLVDRFRVLALDQRGHGESAWAPSYQELRLVGDVVEFVEMLGLGTFSLSASPSGDRRPSPSPALPGSGGAAGGV